MQTTVLSKIESFALVDLVYLIKQQRIPLTVEYRISEEVTDAVYAMSKLKELFKKQLFMVTLEEPFLSELKNGKIRDYVFEQIIQFSLFRVEDKVYSLEGITSQEELLTQINNSVYQTALVYSISDPLPIVSNTDFLILVGSENLFDLKNITKLL